MRIRYHLLSEMIASHFFTVALASSALFREPESLQADVILHNSSPVVKACQKIFLDFCGKKDIINTEDAATSGWLQFLV